MVKVDGTAAAEPLNRRTTRRAYLHGVTIPRQTGEMSVPTIDERKMKAVFFGLVYLYMAATTLAIWSSLTPFAARRRLLLALAWVTTAFELVGISLVFWMA
ncbi:MAG TPA: hypothetical protein VIM71_05670, partial [Lacunisphaera sp.]